MYTDFNGQKWYKGNLHTHTTLSDGRVSYDEAVARYRHMGYDFLSITDHWVPSQTITEKGFLLLSGCEYDIVYYETHNDTKRQVIIHINGIGFTSPPKLEKDPALRGQVVIDAVRAAGGFAFFCHPGWSRNILTDTMGLQNLAGMEIYNSGCNFIDDYSGLYVDQLAMMGINLPVFACDDSHAYTREEGKSFIMVRSDDLSREGILDAINNRRFFASQGPWLEAKVEGRSLRVTCTPVTEIRVYTNRYGGWTRAGNGITGFALDLPESVYYYRVEVTDKDGNRAWTSPVKI